MWMITLRDLQWRRRRFVIAVIATSLVFSLTLVLDGIMAHFDNEIDQVVGLFRADTWVVADGGAGPFTTTKLMPADLAADLRRLRGVERADPLIQARETVRGTWVNLLGYTVGGLGEPAAPNEGALPAGPHEALVDTLLAFDVGETIVLGGEEFRVVGTVDNASYNFGAPTVLLPIEEVQRLFLAGQPFVGAVAVQGVVDNAPPGMRVMTNDEVAGDLRAGMEAGIQTVDAINGLLWLVAAGIIGSIVYLSALERTRDFAVMKATGASNRSLMGGLAIAALVLSVLAGIGAAVLAVALGPQFPLPVETPPSSYLTLFVVSLVIGLLASLAGLRRAVRVDPALAFRGG